ncbi:fungal-specific transcription factor domain-containing protein [Xylariales sp. PMI_506]|nr:fungal-specific transcription factor domain-containing protein [Xylariales sp. PMI_506]
MADHGATGLGAQRTVKRPRPVKSCIECRNRKLRCDRLLPCSQCQKSHRNCRYAADGDVANLSDGSDNGMPDRPPKKSCGTGKPESVTGAPDQASSASSGLWEDYGSRLERLEKIVLAGPRGSAYSDSNSRRALPLASSSLTIRGLTVKGSLRTRFFGQNSTRVLLNLFDEAKEFMFSKNKPLETAEIFSSVQKIHKSLQEEQQKALAPITVYVDSITPVQKRMADVLPKKSVCDHLLHVFLTGSESLYRSVHIPTFMSQYDQWWEGKFQSEVFLPQLLSMLCIGYRFLGVSKGLVPDRDGIHIPTAVALVREWVNGLRGKQLVDFSTLQAEVLLVMACRMINPSNQDSWTQLGIIVRMAMTMGLHRDPSEFPQKISPFWGELRRRLWFTILELDIQMCIQCNMPACIRESDYTCRAPINIDDDELHPDMTELPEGRPIDQPTDSQIQVFAASTLSARFKVIDLINRIDTISDYQQVIEGGNALERIFEDMRYIVLRKQAMTKQEETRQWMTKTILDFHLRRAILALYRPYALSTPEVPQQIITAYLRSSAVLLTYLDDLDQSSPAYVQISHMHHLVLKQDVLQAAFSVCHYIMHSTSPSIGNRSPSSYSRGSSPRYDSLSEACTIATDSSLLLSRQRLISAVERALEDMNGRLREIGTDVKDLVSLTVVLAVCQGGHAELKRERANNGLRAIVDAGLQSIRPSQDNISSSIPVGTLPPPRPLSTINGDFMRYEGIRHNVMLTGLQVMAPTPLPINTLGPHGGYMNPSPIPPYLMTPEIPNAVCLLRRLPARYGQLIADVEQISDDFAMWDLEFWNPLLQSGTG